MSKQKQNWRKTVVVAIGLGSVFALSSVEGATIHYNTMVADAFHTFNLNDGDIINVANENGIELRGVTVNKPNVASTINVLNGSGIVESGSWLTPSNLTLGKTNIQLNPNFPGTVSGVVLRNDKSSIITLGENSSIIGASIYTELEGVRVYNGNKVNFGNGATVDLTSDYALGLSASGAGSEINFAGSSNITISGVDGIGVYVDEGGRITFNGPTKIEATGMDVIAVNVVDGGFAEFNGDTTISVPTDHTAVVSNNFGGAQALVTLNGKLNITGYMVAADGGVLMVNATPGSILTGGSYIEDGGVLSYTLNNSQWNMTGESSITTLALSGGSTVNFLTPSYHVFHADNISSDGTGLFNMRTHIGAQEGDQVHVENLSGNLKVAVTDMSAGNVDASSTWLLVDTQSSSTGTITLDHPVDVGAYQYGLNEADNGTDRQYILASNGSYSSTTRAVPNFVRAAYLNNYVETNSLMKRMGDIRGGVESEGNIWARAFGGEMEVDRKGPYSGFTQDYHGFQIGMDKKVSSTDKRDIYVGGHLGYTKSNSDFGAMGSGDIDSYYGGLYGLYHQPQNGFYIDGVFKIGSMKSEQEILQSGTNWVSDKDNAMVWALSVETGKRFFFNSKKERQGFYLEPQAKISVGNIGSSSYQLGNTTVDIDDTSFAMGRLGVLVGYDISKSKNPINVYGKLSFVSDFGSDLNTNVSGADFSTDLGSSWWVYGLGITAQIKDKHNLYLDIERASGGDFTQKWQLNGGYRYSW